MTYHLKFSQYTAIRSWICHLCRDYRVTFNCASADSDGLKYGICETLKAKIIRKVWHDIPWQNILRKYIPVIFALCATPTAHTPFATAAISPAHRVPWWFDSEMKKHKLATRSLDSSYPSWSPVMQFRIQNHLSSVTHSWDASRMTAMYN